MKIAVLAIMALLVAGVVLAQIAPPQLSLEPGDTLTITVAGQKAALTPVGVATDTALPRVYVIGGAPGQGTIYQLRDGSFLVTLPVTGAAMR